MGTPRRILAPITADLQGKMVLLAGARQVGKTTLAKQALDATPTGLYLSWDRRDDRRVIRDARWPAGRALIVLDELHKWRQWKRWLKGEFDAHREHLQFLVTGSARMDVFRRGSDSLQGRYHHWRLHPFTLGEVERAGSPIAVEPGKALALDTDGRQETVQALMTLGGFPEPFLAGSERGLRRWRKERLDRFFREDVRDLENLRDMSSLELLADMLPSRVGSPLSLNSLREDLEVSHTAVTHWIDVLERLYFLFLVRPYKSRAVRSLRKMPKAYLWDATLVEDRGARFENLVALHLLTLCHFLEDGEGEKVELRYLRDTSEREVDFLVTWNGKPWLAVEAKVSDTEIAPSLRYFRSRLGIPHCYQVVLDGTQDYAKDGIRCLPAARLFAALP
jgi:uncharacterized protein